MHSFDKVLRFLQVQKSSFSLNFDHDHSDDDDDDDNNGDHHDDDHDQTM